ncbi:MAG: hypothetical protein RL119_1434 [Actinomycetota bacterium]|jgi:cell division protein FtsL
MARALQVPKSRPSVGKPVAKGVKPAARTAKPAVRKVTPRTSTDRQRAKASPLARAVSQKNAPKATRIFIYTTVTLALLTITLMMVVVVFQTRLAETQMNIDAIEQQISVERARYDELRLQRSSLREPSRLVTEATALGMVPGTKTTFKSVDPSAVASVLVSLGGLDLEQFSNTLDPLKNYSAVKALVGGG